MKECPTGSKFRKPKFLSRKDLTDTCRDKINITCEHGAFFLRAAMTPPSGRCLAGRQ